MSPCGDFRGDGSGCEVNEEQQHGKLVYELTNLFGRTSSAKTTQGFAVKLNPVKIQMLTCRFEKHNTNKSR